MCAFEREHDSYYSAQRESKRKNVKQNRSTGLRTPMYSHGFTFFPYLILLVQSELSVIESAGCASMKLKRKKKKKNVAQTCVGPCPRERGREIKDLFFFFFFFLLYKIVTLSSGERHLFFFFLLLLLLFFFFYYLLFIFYHTFLLIL